MPGLRHARCRAHKRRHHIVGPRAFGHAFLRHRARGHRPIVRLRRAAPMPGLGPHARIHEPQIAGVPVHLRIVLGDAQRTLSSLSYLHHRREENTCIPTNPAACLREIHIDLDGDTIKHVDFVGGQTATLRPSAQAHQGKNIDEVASVLEGNTCGRRSTSCADQLVQGLRQPTRLSSAPRTTEATAFASPAGAKMCACCDALRYILRTRQVVAYTGRLPFGKHFSLGSHVAWI